MIHQTKKQPVGTAFRMVPAVLLLFSLLLILAGLHGQAGFERSGFSTADIWTRTRELGGEAESLYREAVALREKLYAAIDDRVDRMMAQGLLSEVKGLRDRGYDRKLPALQAIGYAQLFAYLDGEVSLDMAVDNIKRATRQFAKRQLTWFRRDERIRWFDCEHYEEAYPMIEGYVKETIFE